MKDIEFGKFLYELRKENNLTQRYVAYELDITDKAVSKWESGESKPNVDKLRKLSVLYNVPLDELVDPHSIRSHKVKITKIVLTGGPCAGKTTAQSWIMNYFTKKGYKVIFVPDCLLKVIVPFKVVPLFKFNLFISFHS